jgi:hypothetical protein
VNIGLPEIIALLLAFGALLGAFGKVLLSQINKQFSAAEDARRQTAEHWDSKFRDLESQLRENERQMANLRADLPMQYVRREDWIRFSGTIDAKLDNINTKLDGLREKVAHV